MFKKLKKLLAPPEPPTLTNEEISYDLERGYNQEVAATHIANRYADMLQLQRRTYQNLKTLQERTLQVGAVVPDPGQEEYLLLYQQIQVMIADIENTLKGMMENQ